MESSLDQYQRGLLRALLAAWKVSEDQRQPFKAFSSLPDWSSLDFSHPGLDAPIKIKRFDFDALEQIGFLTISKPYGQGVGATVFHIAFIITGAGQDYGDRLDPLPTPNAVKSSQEKVASLPSFDRALVRRERDNSFVTLIEALGKDSSKPFEYRRVGDDRGLLFHPGFAHGSVEPIWEHIQALAHEGFVTIVPGIQRGTMIVRVTERGLDRYEELDQAIARRKQVTHTKDKAVTPLTPRLFIVHGQDEQTKWAVKNYLQNHLKLPEPVVLHERPNRGRTLIEKFEDHAEEVDGAVVLLTPDDQWLSEGTNEELRRARQNVVFELGFFLGKLGRRSGKVLLLYKSPLELPSDIAGIAYINIDHGVEAAGEQIRRELDPS